MTTLISQVQAALREHIKPEKAAFFPKYMQAHEGGYGQGDQFLGITMPNIRAVVKEYALQFSLEELQPLIRSKWHEERMCGLLMLVQHYQKSKKDEEKQAACIALYLKQLDWVNNWDLVDCTAYHLLGDWLLTRDRSLLYELAESQHLWRERVAMVATLAFIRQGQFTEAYQLAEFFLSHPHSLMHKAVGWMLRESGKRDEQALTEFLDSHYQNMPRTSLRYAIERFSEPVRQAYLQGKR